MKKHILTGFGFGPIQGGLFVKEAFESSGFERIVVAEVDQTLVDAVRADGNRYSLNVARADGIETVKIENVELLNPSVARDRQQLVEALRGGEVRNAINAPGFGKALPPALRPYTELATRLGTILATTTPGALSRVEVIFRGARR